MTYYDPLDPIGSLGNIIFTDVLNVPGAYDLYARDVAERRTKHRVSIPESAEIAASYVISDTLLPAPVVFGRGVIRGTARVLEREVVETYREDVKPAITHGIDVFEEKVSVAREDVRETIKRGGATASTAVERERKRLQELEMKAYAARVKAEEDMKAKLRAAEAKVELEKERFKLGIDFIRDVPGYDAELDRINAEILRRLNAGESNEAVEPLRVQYRAVQSDRASLTIRLARLRQLEEAEARLRDYASRGSDVFAGVLAVPHEPQKEVLEEIARLQARLQTKGRPPRKTRKAKRRR